MGTLNHGGLVFLEIRVIKIYLAVTIYFRTRKAMTKCESI